MTDNSIIFPGLTNPKNPSYKPSARVRTQYFYSTLQYILKVRIVLSQNVQQSWPSYNTSDPVIEQVHILKNWSNEGVTAESDVFK